MKEEEEEVHACCSSKGSVTATYYSFSYLHDNFFSAVCHYELHFVLLAVNGSCNTACADSLRP